MPGLKDEEWAIGLSPWEAAVLPRAGLSHTEWAWTAGKNTLVAAVDPEAEARLSGLDQALISGEYFSEPSYHLSGDSGEIYAVVNSDITLPHRVELELSRVDVEPGYEAIFRALEHPRPGYFETLLATPAFSHSHDFRSEYLTGEDAGRFVEQTGGPIQYERAGETLIATPWAVDNRGNLDNTDSAVRLFREPGEQGTNLHFVATGHFDASKLDFLPPDSPVAVPQEIYSYQGPQILEYADGSVPE
ncbi:MAG: hypothetical protein FH749_15795 [Firmicutes bacterium]|nr:hypothetical protein [Bacillota bacterium]